MSAAVTLFSKEVHSDKDCRVFFDEGPLKREYRRRRMTTHGIPSVVELPKKISAKLSARIARKPKR